VRLAGSFEAVHGDGRVAAHVAVAVAVAGGDGGAVAAVEVMVAGSPRGQVSAAMHWHDGPLQSSVD